MLIDSSYFVGELNIPNTSQTEVLERLNWFIAKHEPQLLQYLFGYELYKAFAAADQSTQPWADLLNGVEYTCNGRLFKWQGLRDTAGKRSLVANYVYYHFLRDDETTTTGVGEVKTNPQNAVMASAASKAAKAWNEMSDCIIGLIHYLNEKKDSYAGWEKQDVWCLRRAFKKINALDL